MNVSAWGLSIKARIALATFFVMTALGAMVAALSLGAYHDYKKLQTEGCQAAVDAETRSLEGQIAALEENVKSLALMGQLLYEGGGDRRDLGRRIVVWNFSAGNAAVGGGVWFEPRAVSHDRERLCYYAFRDKFGQVWFDGSFESEAYDYPTQKWYTIIRDGLLNKGLPTVWTAPYHDETGTLALMTTVGHGIFKGDEFVGMATADWELDSIAHRIATVRPTPGSFTLFADGVNDVILAYTGKENNVRGRPLEVLPWLHDALQDKTLIIGGRRHLVFQGRLANGMLIVSFVPEAELFVDIHRTFSLTVFVLAFAGVFLAGVIWFLLNRLINRPIERLTRKAEEIGAGNLDVHIGIDSRDEFGRLSGTVERMARDLKDYIGNLKTVTAEKERIAAELGVAARIQISMLPRIFPPFPDRPEFDLYASMSPAKEVGGDFYDFFFVDSHTLAVVMADVSGKGIPAALFMVIARTLIKNNAQQGGSPKEVFETVNDLLCENNEEGMFVTAFMGYLDIAGGSFVSVNAGHTPPFVRQKGEFSRLPVRPAFVLAGRKGTKYREEKTELNAGDLLFLYTDGVTEATDRENELFSEARLLETLNTRGKNADSQSLLESVKGAIDRFAEGAEQADDITMLALRMTPPEAASAEDGQPQLRASRAFEANVRSVGEVYAFISETLKEGGVSEGDILKTEMAAEEIFVNVASYAYGDAEHKPVTLELAVQSDRVTMTFTDWGVPFDPMTVPPPDLTLKADRRAPGGLGLFMVKSTMDAMTCSRIDGKNVLTLTLALTQTSGAL